MNISNSPAIVKVERVESQKVEVKGELYTEMQQASSSTVSTELNIAIKKEDCNQQESSVIGLKRKIDEDLQTDGHVKVEDVSKRKRNDSEMRTASAKNSQEATVEQPLYSTLDAEETYSLLVSNFPATWSFPQMCNYISQSLQGVSVEMEPVIGNSKNELRLTFNTPDHRLNSQIALQNKEVDGNKLNVVLEAPVQYENDSVSTDEIPSRISDIWDEDPAGLYGLKKDYLNILNITPPIGNWIHVTNFRCDKSELRDVFELAGNVVICSIITVQNKYAKVMYSHPLEAVQSLHRMMKEEGDVDGRGRKLYSKEILEAVSMLNDQVFYGQKLSVKMDKTMAANNLLPKGLLGVGPGLGEDGNGVREITREYERFLNGKTTKINLSLFTAGNINGIVISKKTNHTAPISDKDTKIATTKSKPILPSSTLVVTKPSVSSSPSRPSRPMRPNFGNNHPTVPHDPNNHYRFPSPSPMFRGPMHRGPMMRPMGEMCSPGPFHRGFPPGPARMPLPYGPRPPMPMAGPMLGVPQNWCNSQTVALMPQMSKCVDATTLKISNLPPTTSFPSLCGKLSTLAQVTSLEFTTPGCAVVKFASPSDAEKCFQNYRNIELS